MVAGLHLVVVTDPGGLFWTTLSRNALKHLLWIDRAGYLVWFQLLPVITCKMQLLLTSDDFCESGTAKSQLPDRDCSVEGLLSSWSDSRGSETSKLLPALCRTRSRTLTTSCLRIHPLEACGNQRTRRCTASMRRPTPSSERPTGQIW